MILVRIDIGKNKHIFSISEKNSGEILSNRSVFDNNQNGFLLLIQKLSNYSKSEILIGIEDTGHYHFAQLKYLLDRRYTVALINPTTNDPLDSLAICDVIGSNKRKKTYRITKINRFDLYEQKQLTPHHHNLKKELYLYNGKKYIIPKLDIIVNIEKSDTICVFLEYKKFILENIDVFFQILIQDLD